MGEGDYLEYYGINEGEITSECHGCQETGTPDQRPPRRIEAISTEEFIYILI